METTLRFFLVRVIGATGAEVNLTCDDEWMVLLHDEVHAKMILDFYRDKRRKERILVQ